MAGCVTIYNLTTIRFLSLRPSNLHTDLTTIELKGKTRIWICVSKIADFHQKKSCLSGVGLVGHSFYSCHGFLGFSGPFNVGTTNHSTATHSFCHFIGWWSSFIQPEVLLPFLLVIQTPGSKNQSLKKKHHGEVSTSSFPLAVVVGSKPTENAKILTTRRPCNSWNGTRCLFLEKSFAIKGILYASSFDD